MNEKKFDLMITIAGKKYIREETKKFNQIFNKQGKIELSIYFKVKMWYMFKKALIKDMIFNYLLKRRNNHVGF